MVTKNQVKPVSRESIEDKQGVQRISISLKTSIFRALDKLVQSKGFENRSQAVSEMIHRSVIEHNQDEGDKLMAGTITLFYDDSTTGVAHRIALLQRENIGEVVSSQHVLLENNHTMEVMIVQGPAHHLKTILNQFIVCKGVKSGKLVLTSTILPPLHKH
jgi:CopG family transcriptional regulator, nickel-responsive regulator